MKKVFRSKKEQPVQMAPSLAMRFPTFFIIGANKAGTTSLHYYCKQHPEIFMSESKEPMFFTAMGPLPDKKDEQVLDKPRLYYQYFTLQEYMSLFASANEPVRGESSTSYLSNPKSTMWIRKLIPDAKLIVILRNPIERAISDYEFQIKRNKAEARTLSDAMNDALNGYIRESNIEKVGDNIRRSPKRYLVLGLYGSQLSIVKQFFPDDQLFIADYEEYNRDTVGFAQKVYRYLGVGDFIPPNTKRLNVSENRNHQLNSELEKKLKEFFEEDVNLLQSMVDFDVTKWLE